MQEHRVMMFVDGREVPGSCLKTGPATEMYTAAARLNRDAAPRVTYRVLPCVEAPRAKRLVALYRRIDGDVTITRLL